MAALAPSQTSTVRLSADLYQDVREFLSDTQTVDAVAIDSFVEKAVRSYLLREATKVIQEAMAPQIAHLSEDEFMAEIDEVLAEVRADASDVSRFEDDWCLELIEPGMSDDECA